MSITPNDRVTDTELAALAGISARRIRQLVEQGTLERVGRNQYELGPSIRALLEDAAGSGSELQRERIRKVRADADRAELAYAIERKAVAPVDEFESVQAAVAAIIRQRMRDIPERVVLQLLGETDETTFKQKLLAEIDDALTAAYHEVESYEPGQIQP